MRPDLLLALIQLGLLGADASGAPSVLTGASLRRADGVRNEPRMRDGVLAWDGDVWDGALSAILGPSAVVEWDLGRSVALDAVYLQADNNDVYVLSTSEDGISWSPLWTAQVHDIPGLQSRTAEKLGRYGRYLRLTAEGGDGLYSVSELMVFSASADLLPAVAAARSNRPPRQLPGSCDPGLEIVAFAIALIAFVLWRRQGPRSPAKA